MNKSKIRVIVILGEILVIGILALVILLPGSAGSSADTDVKSKVKDAVKAGDAEYLADEDAGVASVEEELAELERLEAERLKREEEERLEAERLRLEEEEKAKAAAMSLGAEEEAALNAAMYD